MGLFNFRTSMVKSSDVRIFRCLWNVYLGTLSSSAYFNVSDAGLHISVKWDHCKGGEKFLQSVRRASCCLYVWVKLSCNVKQVVFGKISAD